MPSKSPDRAERVGHQMEERVVPQGEDVRLGNQLEKVQDFLVLPENQGVESRFRKLLPDSEEHRLREDEAPHLGKKNHQDAARRRRIVRFVPRRGKNRQQPTERSSDVAVDPSLKVDVHV